MGEGTIGSALRRKVDGDKSASGLLKERNIYCPLSAKKRTLLMPRDPGRAPLGVVIMAQ